MLKYFHHYKKEAVFMSATMHRENAGKAPAI